jgi:hypothetical protein
MTVLSVHEPREESYTLVDATIGSRILLGFHAAPDAVQARLPRPWVSQPYAGSMRRRTG